jgi:putative flippase GtrA
MQKILLVIAVIAGLFFAYVDSRPTWDDTGITVGAVLLTSGLLALIGFQRPWLLALAVGLWIPLYEILMTHAYASIIALIIAFIGAYGGWAIRLGISTASHTV